MELNELNTQILLEILLNQRVDKNLKEELPKILRLYLRKLSCLIVGVYGQEGFIHILPKSVLRNDQWIGSINSCLKQLNFKLQNPRKSYYKDENIDFHFYALPLNRTYFLILIRQKKLGDSMFFELSRIVESLGKDITHYEEQKKLNILQTLVDQSPDAIQISKASGQLYYINQEASKRLGIPKSEAESYSVLDFEKSFNNEIKKWESHIKEIEEKGEMIINGENISRETKKTFPVEVTVKTANFNNENFVFASSRNISHRIEQEKKLEETSNKFTSILNEVTDVIYSFKLPELDILFVSPSVKSVFEIDRKVSINSYKDYEHIFLGENQNIKNKIRNQLQQKGSFSVKYQIKTPLGNSKWIRNRGKYIYNEDNKPIRIDGIILDRTSQYDAQKKLEQESKLQNTLIDIASTYINLDLSEVEHTINQSLKKMGLFVEADRSYIFDYNLEKGTTSNTYEWCNDGISPEIDNLQNVPVEYIPQWIESHKKGKAFYVPRVESLPDDGPEGLKAILEPQGIKSLITIPLKDKDELVGFVGFDTVNKHHVFTKKEQNLLFLFGQMLINIKNRQRWEKRLRLNEQKYRNIISNMKLGLVEVDLNDKIIFANQTFCKMSGYNLNELQGNVIDKIIPHNNYKPTKLNNENETGAFYDSYELEIQNKNGDKRWWFISGAPNHDDKGKLIGSIGIHLDITEQKKLELELEKAKSFAEAGAKAKELFLANMSHEIRTPLNVIIGMIRQLNKEKLSKNQYFYVNQSESSAKHLLTIINNILDVAKIESGDMDIINREFSPSALIYNVHSILYSQANDKGLNLNIQIDPDVSEILIGDETRVRQVLINLIGNSIKFTYKGEINLTLSLVSTNNEMQRLKFCVQDTGIGMSAEFVKKIFEKFSQEQDTSTRTYEGTGLGMAISNDLINLMGSELKVKSEKGKGSEFSFELDFKIGKKENLVVKSVHIKQNIFKGKKALLVEDNAMNRFIALQSLDYLGFKTVEAENGKIAIQKVQEDEFDIILMDIQMPVMDGMASTKFIRNNLNCNTPIIALTANAFKHDIESYLAIGMNDYITKPYDESDFFRKVNHMIELNNKNKIKIDSFINNNQQNEDEISENKQTSQPEKLHNKQTSKLYDLSKIEKMSAGSSEFINKMKEIFIGVAEDTNQKMLKALENLEIEEINKLAHKLKPSIDQLSILNLQEEVRHLEKFTFKKSNKEELNYKVKNLVKVLSAVIEDLKKE